MLPGCHHLLEAEPVHLCISLSPPAPPPPCITAATIVCHFTGLENISFKLNATAVQTDMLMAWRISAKLVWGAFFSLFQPACWLFSFVLKSLSEFV